MNPPPSADWTYDWAEHELRQLRAGAARSFRENLQWLEEAAAFAERLRAAPVVAGPIKNGF